MMLATAAPGIHESRTNGSSTHARRLPLCRSPWASPPRPSPRRRTSSRPPPATTSSRTLVAAVKAADLVETLSGEGPFTVFAPTDEAFAKLPEGTLETLLKPENKEKLVAILTYHVVPGKVMAADVVKLDGEKVETAAGAEGHDQASTAARSWSTRPRSSRPTSCAPTA